MKLYNNLKNFQFKNIFTIKKAVFFFFYIIFVITLFYILYLQIRNGYPKESWQITELLTNYQGGFVRRGLIGEILLNLYKYCNFNPYLAILFLCFSSYIALLFFFLYSFLKKGLPLILLPFTFFLGGPILNNQWVRKDIIITLFFIIALYFSIKKSNIYIILVNFFLIIAILIHEGAAFFSLPIILLILINNNFYNSKFSLKKSFLLSIFKLSPSIITFFLCIYFHGSTAIAKVVWHSWDIAKFPIQSSDNSIIPTAIGAISWSFKEHLNNISITLKNFNGGIYAPLAWFFIVLLIYHFLANTNKLQLLIFKTNKNHSKTSISNILIFQFLMLIPQFIVGYDYGRWIFFWVSSSFAILILVPSERLTILFPGFISWLSSRVNSFLDSIIVMSKDFIYIVPFFIGIPHYIWFLNDYLNTTPIIIIFRSISKVIHIILSSSGISFSEVYKFIYYLYP